MGLLQPLDHLYAWCLVGFDADGKMACVSGQMVGSDEEEARKLAMHAIEFDGILGKPGAPIRGATLYAWEIERENMVAVLAANGFVFERP